MPRASDSVVAIGGSAKRGRQPPPRSAAALAPASSPQPRLGKRLVLLPLLLLALAVLSLTYAPLFDDGAMRPSSSALASAAASAMLRRDASASASSVPLPLLDVVPAPPPAAAAAPLPPPLPPPPAPSPPAPASSTDRFAYRSTQYAHGGFPASYESRLYTAAVAAGVSVPDVLAGGGASPVCPPHDRDASGARVPTTAMSSRLSAAEYSSGGLAALRRVTLGLVVVSHDSPKSLLATLAAWRASGLLALADDAVAVLSAPLDAEVAACLAAGFRVYTPRADETAALRARHAGWLAQFDGPDAPPFPPVRDLGGDADRPATFVGPAQAMAYLDMATDLILFAEKDYRLDARMPAAQTLRSLLAAEAMLAANTAVVRLRRMDDKNTEALPNCCQGQCAGTFSDFTAKCSWQSHLDWCAAGARRAQAARAAAPRIVATPPSITRPAQARHLLRPRRRRRALARRRGHVPRRARAAAAAAARARRRAAARLLLFLRLVGLVQQRRHVPARVVAGRAWPRRRPHRPRRQWHVRAQHGAALRLHGEEGAGHGRGKRRRSIRLPARAGSLLSRGGRWLGKGALTRGEFKRSVLYRERGGIEK